MVKAFCNNTFSHDKLWLVMNSVTKNKPENIDENEWLKLVNWLYESMESKRNTMGVCSNAFSN